MGAPVFCLARIGKEVQDDLSAAKYRKYLMGTFARFARMRALIESGVKMRDGMAKSV
jgi:hypothetical protein